jgi:hypothetical protein
LQPRQICSSASHLTHTRAEPLQLWSDNYIKPPNKGGWSNWGTSEPRQGSGGNWLDRQAYAQPQNGKPGKWRVGSMWSEGSGTRIAALCRMRRESLTLALPPLPGGSRAAIVVAAANRVMHAGRREAKAGLACHAGPPTYYTPQYMSVSKTGCQPANSSTWLSFSGDWWMYRWVRRQLHGGGSRMVGFGLATS